MVLLCQSAAPTPLLAILRVPAHLWIVPQYRRRRSVAAPADGQEVAAGGTLSTTPTPTPTPVTLATSAPSSLLHDATAAVPSSPQAPHAPRAPLPSPSGGSSPFLDLESVSPTPLLLGAPPQLILGTSAIIGPPPLVAAAPAAQGLPTTATNQPTAPAPAPAPPPPPPPPPAQSTEPTHCACPCPYVFTSLVSTTSSSSGRDDTCCGCCCCRACAQDTPIQPHFVLSRHDHVQCTLIRYAQDVVGSIGQRPACVLQVAEALRLAWCVSDQHQAVAGLLERRAARLRRGGGGSSEMVVDLGAGDDSIGSAFMDAASAAEAQVAGGGAEDWIAVHLHRLDEGVGVTGGQVVSGGGGGDVGAIMGLRSPVQSSLPPAASPPPPPRPVSRTDSLFDFSDGEPSASPNEDTDGGAATSCPDPIRAYLQQLVAQAPQFARCAGLGLCCAGAPSSTASAQPAAAAEDAMMMDDDDDDDELLGTAVSPWDPETCLTANAASAAAAAATSSSSDRAIIWVAVRQAGEVLNGRLIAGLLARQALEHPECAGLCGALAVQFCRLLLHFWGLGPGVLQPLLSGILVAMHLEPTRPASMAPHLLLAALNQPPLPRPPVAITASPAAAQSLLAHTHDAFCHMAALALRHPPPLDETKGPATAPAQLSLVHITSPQRGGPVLMAPARVDTLCACAFSLAGGLLPPGRQWVRGRWVEVAQAPKALYKQALGTTRPYPTTATPPPLASAHSARSSSAVSEACATGGSGLAVAPSDLMEVMLALPAGMRYEGTHLLDEVRVFVCDALLDALAMRHLQSLDDVMPLPQPRPAAHFRWLRLVGTRTNNGIGNCSLTSRLVQLFRAALPGLAEPADAVRAHLDQLHFSDPIWRSLVSCLPAPPLGTALHLCAPPAVAPLPARPPGALVGAATSWPHACGPLVTLPPRAESGIETHNVLEGVS
ncbi:hypothetical protein PAPYR_8981 [Paratrimastix pyriformis]|uniref:Uncharacterized protein n=1 Tax=Paratrimastix pyriformis TaxID=342808 RepID=A0ABQ8UD16_9EUKA|nr:hypothetical protein PAPYR_8981 [Paratrimastix pyriformis]